MVQGEPYGRTIHAHAHTQALLNAALRAEPLAEV